jgi:hypothetical protein
MEVSKMQLSLFSSGDFLQYADESAVRSLLSDANPLLWSLVRVTWDEFQGDRQSDSRFRDLDEGEAAWWLHLRYKRLAELFTENSPEYGILCGCTIDRQFYLNLHGELVIVFKKLTRRFSKRLGHDVLMRSNYPTTGNCDFWEQRKRDGAVDATRVILGYEPIKEMTDVKIYIGYPRTRGRWFTWIYEMDDQMEESRRISREIKERELLPTQQETKKGFVVEPRRKASEVEGA